MPTTTFTATVVRRARLMKDALRSARSRTEQPQTDPYIRGLAKEILSREDQPRRRAVEQVCALVDDLAHRGSLEEAESIGYLFVAIAQHSHAALAGALSVSIDIATAHMAEECAEADVEQAECAMAHPPHTISKYLAYLTASAAHIRARHQLDAVIRHAVIAEHATT